MGKIDLYKLHADEYATPEKPVLIEVKRAKYLTAAGQGAPGGELFTALIGALYAMAYTVKMRCKAAGKDYVVCKLEGQWWTEEGACDLRQVPQGQWRWRLMIRTPDFITDKHLEEAGKVLAARGKSPHVSQVQLETIQEGLCVQMLHVGPYEKESETIAVMSQFIEREGLAFHGLHHEIYLSDPRRVAPERLRTILRHPVKRR
jgi:hypothetical protein